MSTISPPAVEVTPAPAATGPAKCGFVINGELRLPAMPTLEAFLDWWEGAGRPERGRFAYLDGVCWVDLMTEQLYSHNQLKQEIATVLGHLAKSSGAGRFFPDGADFANEAASLATTPDGMYVSYESRRSGKVVQKPSRDQAGFIRIEGTPDTVLEVVSDSSEEKDKALLPALYHRAGIPEFWRVDARGDVVFEAFRWTATGYAPTALPDGWWHSDVFGRDFLLIVDADPLGDPQYTLQHRP